jgi:hypothetical protein
MMMRQRRGIVDGLRSVGFIQRPMKLHYELPDDSDSIDQDWLMTGQDLCDAMLKYTPEAHHGGTLPIEREILAQSRR